MVSARKKTTDAPISTSATARDSNSAASYGVYVTIHGHYYQPPRENPYLNAIERQPSAHPARNWNERIYHECYRPNAFARILNNRAEVVGIVNNFEYLSFNVGATLMSWLEKYDLEVYQKIIEGDRKSQERLDGNGNAIAQVYNHIIMPLANQRDKYTQIRWGKADFRARFGRNPEGMWLAETAVDLETLEALIDEDIRFIILAPSQAQRCRLLPTAENPESQWQEVGGSQIDPTRPYRCFVDEERYIDIFFYDGPISRDMGFSDALNHADNLASRLGQAIRGDRHNESQLVSVATDGETFGHHKGGTEKCLAYAFTEVFPQRNWQVTNYAHYLSLYPPTWEVQLKPVTAWSCAHGVERWRSNCGCGGGGSWQQEWRKPLREALDWLRDRLIPLYEDAASSLFQDPWQARDEYIDVINTAHSPDAIAQFFSQQQSHPLSEEEQTDALRLLEMQRHCLLMYTSCGWFFDEISRPEGVQILRYASRAIQLAGEVAGIHYQLDFISLLSKAPSNVDVFRNGGDIYRQLVIPSQVSLEQVAAHYAISSLFDTYSPRESIYCYTIEQVDYHKRSMGTMSLAVGQVKITSSSTWEHQHFTFAALHLGGWDFHCCIKPFLNRLDYSTIKEDLFRVFSQASAAQTMLAMNRLLGEQHFDLQHLFADERHRVMSKLTKATKQRLDRLYTQAYRENYSILLAFQREGLTIPQELQVAANVALSHRVQTAILALRDDIIEPEAIDRHLIELQAIASEARHLNCKLELPEAKTALENLVLRMLWQLLNGNNRKSTALDVARIEEIIKLGHQLDLGLCLSRPQELYFACLQEKIVPKCIIKSRGCRWSKSQLKPLLALGQKLGIDVDCWLKR